jgi:hypothetical protein
MQGQGLTPANLLKKRICAGVDERHARHDEPADAVLRKAHSLLSATITVETRDLAHPG